MKTIDSLTQTEQTRLKTHFEYNAAAAVQRKRMLEVVEGKHQRAIPGPQMQRNPFRQKR